MTAGGIDKKYRKCTFRVWKRGAEASVVFNGPISFQRAERTDLMPRDRIFAVDTESLTCEGELRTLLVPVHFHDDAVMIETLDGKGMLERLFDLLWRRGHAVAEEKPSATEQREKRKRKNGKKKRDGDRQTIPPLLSVWFNLPYDFGRLTADLHKHFLRSVIAGADSYRLRVSDRFELEVRKMHFGSAASFDWRIREPATKTVVRLLGMDLVGYWKTSLALAAKAVGVAEKIDIESVIEGVYEKPLESFTENEWDLFKAYGIGDVKSTLDLYHATAELLTTIDTRVVRDTGVIPPSAPGASARIMFAKAFDCHPDLHHWDRYPAWADQMGADAYFGGRVFSVLPGVHTRMATLDLKSAYPFQLSLLPDPVTVEMELVNKTKTFRVDAWAGRYGVLYVSGESFDDVYPAFRVHDPERNGRLRYVAGPFAEVAVTIPELVIGVLRGSLRIDEIHKGVVMKGSADRSFLREGVAMFFSVKENQDNAKALRDMAKLLANSSYGKLIEVQAHDYLIAEQFPTPLFVEKEKVCRALVQVFTGSGPYPEDMDGVYWGEEGQIGKAKEAYVQELTAFAGDPEDRGAAAVGWYVQALTMAGVAVTEPGLCSIAQFVQGVRTFKAGQFFMPLYAAQITGATSAMVGLMASCLGALQGDTDSVHVQLPPQIKSITEMPGYQTYFQIMKRAGYASPEEPKKLGSWEEETPEASIESLLARTKLYSHRLPPKHCAKTKPKKEKEKEEPAEEKQPGAVCHGAGRACTCDCSVCTEDVYKQAQHGISKFHSPEIDAVLAGRPFTDVRTRSLVHPKTRDERFALAKKTRAVALHEAVRALIMTKRFSYDAKRSPRKLKEAVARGLPVGEFISRPMDLVLTTDPNTWRDESGKVHWNPFAPGEKHWAEASAPASGTQSREGAAA